MTEKKYLDSSGLTTLTGMIKAKVEDTSNKKQDKLVSGTNIKSINGASILGSGDISIGGRSMNISGTVNLTNGTFNTQNNSSLNSYTKVFDDMSVGEMRMYLVADSSGNLPSTSETAITVPHDGVLSPAQIYFGKSVAFGVSVGDICVLFKRSSIFNICRIIPLNDVKPANGDFPGADGLSTVWDKTRINKVDGIEWTTNHVRDTYLPFVTRDGNNMNECLESGIYPWCNSGRPTDSVDGTHFTCITKKSTTTDWSGYYTYHQTCFGREGDDAGKIYQRVFFLKANVNDTPNWGDGWKRVDNCIKQAVVDLGVSNDDSIQGSPISLRFMEQIDNTYQSKSVIFPYADSTKSGIMHRDDYVKLQNIKEENLLSKEEKEVLECFIGHSESYAQGCNFELPYTHQNFHYGPDDLTFTPPSDYDSTKMGVYAKIEFSVQSFEGEGEGSLVLSIGDASSDNIFRYDITSETVNLGTIIKIVRFPNITFNNNKVTYALTRGGTTRIDQTLTIKDMGVYTICSNKYQSDWNETDIESITYIKNKPEICIVASDKDGLMSKEDKVKLDNTYTKDEIDAKIGDINTILESIINS